MKGRCQLLSFSSTSSPLQQQSHQVLAMAENDYFHSQSTRPDYQPYSNNYSQPSLPSLPSYRSELPGARSPFEAPFDDHVYPLGGQPSQSSFGQDSRYYNQGGGGRPQDSFGSVPDAIPLRDQGPAKENNTTDHVYDAAEAPPYLQNRRPNRDSRFVKVLGGKNGRIPWVVYTFTIIQIAVFIAEIAKNGEFILETTLELLDSCNADRDSRPHKITHRDTPFV